LGLLEHDLRTGKGGARTISAKGLPGLLLKRKPGDLVLGITPADMEALWRAVVIAGWILYDFDLAGVQVN